MIPAPGQRWRYRWTEWKLEGPVNFGVWRALVKQGTFRLVECSGVRLRFWHVEHDQPVGRSLQNGDQTSAVISDREFASMVEAGFFTPAP